MIASKNKKKNGKKDSEEDSEENSNAAAEVPKTVETGNALITPPLPVQTNDDPRGHVGAQDEQVDHTLTPPAPEESVEKVSN